MKVVFIHSIRRFDPGTESSANQVGLPTSFTSLRISGITQPSLSTFAHLFSRSRHLATFARFSSEVGKSGMASRAHSRAGSRAPSGRGPLVVDLPPPDRAPSREPLVLELPPVDRPPIYIDAGPKVVAPGLSGGRGMFKRLIVACDGTLILLLNSYIHWRFSSFYLDYPEELDWKS